MPDNLITRHYPTPLCVVIRLSGIVRRFLAQFQDRKSTRLNSSHQIISYAVFCLKKKRARGCTPVTRSSLVPCSGCAQDDDRRVGTGDQDRYCVSRRCSCPLSRPSYTRRPPARST